MKTFTSTLLAMTLLSTGVSASMITSNTTAINTSGQSYSSLYNLGGIDYSSVSVDLNIKGDYGYYNDEYFHFYIDGVELASWTYTTSGITVTNNYNNYDYSLSGVINIDDLVWSGFSADDNLLIQWSNSSSVNAYSQGGSDFVSYTLNGTPISTSEATTVPEPMPLALLGLGLAVVAFSRRRKV
ncbi:PEP-CTERM sorting domain-containing protein [Neptunomonas phycophila]|uniref:PEP-CTERM sorting domain-containing protein n=1 Tax=Neptunomonas phycophila TaxID=1572645 RepID=UPI001BE7F5B0|nr:PEP-CTERM sorting domain-containing protein [Neptunomonas phycophila]MBT3145640.1 PEP-CTERM sorting domain-containing protein [Neptunomonas phycophila]